MPQWYNNRRLFRTERESLAKACPLLRMVLVGADFEVNRVFRLSRETAIVHGVYDIQVPDSSRSIEYGIVLVLPENYPKSPPLLYCNDPRLPIDNIDRHIMPHGQACLGVNAEIGMRWPPGSSIVDFLNNLVTPFLIWQAYYETHQKAPPWGGRSHFGQGVLEFYRENLGMTGNEPVVGFMRLLARKNQPKGHEPCPCGSGEKLRDCHRKMLYAARERLSWQDVRKDLDALAGQIK